MAEQIMTLGRQIKELVLRGKNTTVAADFREIPFQCQFVGDAVNGAPLIRVSVRQVGKPQPEQIRVELIPPNRSGFGLIGQPFAIRAATFGNFTPRPTEPLAPNTSQPTVVFNTNTGFNPNRFRFDESGDLFTDPFPPDLIDPFPDPIPPGGGGGVPSRKVFIHPLTPGVDPQGRWVMRLHNLAFEAAEFQIDLEYPETVQTLETTRVSFQLLNRVFAEVLLLMRLSLTIDNGQAVIEFDPEFLKLTGITNQRISVNDRLEDINLESFKITAEQDTEFGGPTIRIGVELEERGDEIALPGWDGNIDDLSLQVVFYLDLFAPPLNDFFATALVRQNGKNFPRPLNVIARVLTHPDLIGRWLYYLVFELASSLIAQAIEDARSKLEEALNKLTRDTIGAYIEDTLVHLVNRDHAFHTVRCDKNALIIQHYALPFSSAGLRPGEFGEVTDNAVLAALPPDPIGSTSSETRFGRVASTGLLAELPGNQPTPVRIAASAVPRRRLREGEIDHIVFLMMENRSFDHMLGYLSLKGRAVEGLTGQERNALPEGNPAYVVHHLTETRGIPSPRHDFADAKNQIADGNMTGFVANYITRKAVKDPNLVMGYYTDAELPVYEFFANNFAVCDAWYSSHPGATQPNRFCAMTGQAPESDNFDLTDDRLGYLERTSIFDFLTAFGADWAYAEGKIGFIRMFDRYRLDTRNVIPYQDDFNQGLSDTFVNRVRSGKLPAVTYIDPRFIDIPPSWDANDDLPPADVCYGQALVKEVYTLLSQAETWPRTLLVVTYDEHGGFFDHVAPPGTPAADNPSPLPRVTPKGADHLGVRVPAFLVSPWVDAGSVISTQLEHTSIIKTILERFVSVDHANRGVLGARAAQANSLLPLLRSRPRTDIPSAPEVICRPNIRGARSPAARDDFHTSMRLIGLPAEKRRRLAS